MNPIASIRLRALKAICHANAWTPTDLARQVSSGTVAYWSDLLRGQRSFGEKVARKIEQTLGLTAGSLDHPELPQDVRFELSPRAIRLAKKLDDIQEGPFKEAVYLILERVLQNPTSESVEGFVAPRADWHEPD